MPATNAQFVFFFFYLHHGTSKWQTSTEELEQKCNVCSGEQHTCQTNFNILFIPCSVCVVCTPRVFVTHSFNRLNWVKYIMSSWYSDPKWRSMITEWKHTFREAFQSTTSNAMQANSLNESMNISMSISISSSSSKTNIHELACVTLARMLLQRSCVHLMNHDYVSKRFFFLQYCSYYCCCCCFVWFCFSFILIYSHCGECDSKRNEKDKRKQQHRKCCINIFFFM